MTEPFCIDSRLLGTEKNLLIDGGFSWIPTIPKDVWHLSGSCKLRSDRCLDTLGRLNHRPLDVSPPKKYANMMSTVMSGSCVSPPWSQVMTARDHRTFVEGLINSAKEALATFSKDYYTNVWVPQSRVLRSLQPAKVSDERFREVLAASGMNSRVIEGFRPGPSGYADPIEYDRFGTRTGRLTVESGPGILTVKKDFRDMIIPSNPDGKIVYFDFAALEARVLLYEAGGRCDDVDMYSYINRELFGGTAERKAIKGAVISELYGSSKAALGAALGISGKDLDDFVGKVKGFFRTSDLKKRVKEEFLKTGCITNRHGRKIVIEEPLDHIFVNSYAQSTGVDVSLLGFSEIVDQFAGRPGIRPLFVLHDALILDVDYEDLEFVSNIKSVKVPGYVQKFPITGTL